jgi:hypothetical protein
VKNEEIAYDIVYDLIQKAKEDNEQMAMDCDKASVLSTILKTEGLDEREKISGVIGEIFKLLITQIYQ